VGTYENDKGIEQSVLLLRPNGLEAAGASGTCFLGCCPRRAAWCDSSLTQRVKLTTIDIALEARKQA
jgi:hypothetical protein